MTIPQLTPVQKRAMLQEDLDRKKICLYQLQTRIYPSRCSLLFNQDNITKLKTQIDDLEKLLSQ